MDGKNIVIGQVVSGMETLREIAKVPVDLNERPRIPITITSCGIEDAQDNLKPKLTAVQKFEQI